MKKEQTLRSDLGRKSVAQGTCRAGSARETPLPRPAQAACSGAAFRPVGAQPWEDTGFFRFAPSPPGPAAAPTGRLHAHAPSCFRPLAGVWMLEGPKQIFSSLRLLGLRRGLRGHRTARWLTSGARGLRATLRPSPINAVWAEKQPPSLVLGGTGPKPFLVSIFKVPSDVFGTHPTSFLLFHVFGRLHNSMTNVHGCAHTAAGQKSCP